MSRCCDALPAGSCRRRNDHYIMKMKNVIIHVLVMILYMHTLVSMDTVTMHSDDTYQLVKREKKTTTQI